jgi:sulfide:quinone oxidoreductase
MPIKCGGAPQKIMYLSEETWRKKKISSNINWHTTVGNLFPNCQKYADALAPIAASKGININFKSQLVAVDGSNRVATFKDLDSNTLNKVDFDFLHFAPP